MRQIVFTDIHGMFNLFKNLYDSLDITNKDQLIFLGDYIDRGKQSKEVLDFMIGLKEKRVGDIFLLGNHEDMLLNNKELWLYNGGLATIKSFGLDLNNIQIEERYLNFINSLEYYQETENYIFVHAGIQPYYGDWRKEKQWMLWAREEFYNSKVETKKIIIYGHTISKEVRIDDNKIGIDTGGFYYKNLTCAILPYGDNTKINEIEFKNMKGE